MNEVTAIGIDLGTTNSCVAVVRNGQVEAIENDAGYRTTPSCVAFKGELILIGDSAHEQAGTNPTNTIYSAKRMIGQKYCDIEDDLKYWSFTVKEDYDERPQIEVDFQNRRKQYAPEMISSKVLTHMKEIAERALSHKVTDAVISVPAYFNDSQRQATKNAAAMAGLNVLRIINEPTAAAIDYGLYHKATGVWNVLVFDLGGGTCDVSVLAWEQKKCLVKATTGEKRLGGDDVDQKIVEHCAAEFKEKYNTNFMFDKKARHRLLVACEKAKRTLSTQMQANITVAYQGIDYSMQLTRDIFDDLCRELFNKAMKLVERALSEANLTKYEINDIVVVGGSSRIPKIQRLLCSYFNGKEFKKTRYPDETVARGAALAAAVLAGQTSTFMELTDLTPLFRAFVEEGGHLRRNVENKFLGGPMEAATESSKKMIGIVLGTTNSTVGIVIRGRVEIVQNEHGKRGTPSCVAFKDKEQLIGTTAVDQVNSNMKSTIFGIKKFLGRTFDDCMRNDVEDRLFKIVEGDDRLPKVEVQWGSEAKKKFSPEQISSLLINRMKEITEAHIATLFAQAPITVEGVAIAVPQCFSSSQRQATKDAAIIAGFTEKNVRLISQPIAAAIAYSDMTRQTNRNRTGNGKRNLFVLDIGGGNCEASIVAIEENYSQGNERYILKWTTGSEQLGGDCIDELLVSHYKEKITRHFAENAMHELRSACRHLKEKLSIVDQTKIDVHLDGSDYVLKLSGDFFEKCCTSYFEEVSQMLRATIEAARIDNEQIDDYILIGGTTRIPKIRALIKELLRGKEPNQTINPDEAVAYGAAIYADNLQGKHKISVESKISKSIWIESSAGYVTDVPPQQRQSTHQPFQKESALEEPVAPVIMQSFEEIHIHQLIPEHVRHPCVEITVVAHATGVLEFLATDKLTGERHTLTSTTFQGCVDKDKVKQKMEEKQFSARLANMREHVCGLVKNKTVSERELKEFDSAVANVCNLQDGIKKKERINKLKAIYETIIRNTQENDEERKRKWRRDMPLAEKNAVLPTTKDLFFKRDANRALVFKVCQRISETHKTTVLSGEISPSVTELNIPLKFIFDEDGILQVEGLRRGTSTVRLGCLQKEEIRKMVDEQHKYRGYIVVKRALESSLYNISDKVKEWIRKERFTPDHRILYTAHREAVVSLAASDGLQKPSDYILITKRMSDAKALLEKHYENVVLLEEEHLKKQAEDELKRKKLPKTFRREPSDDGQRGRVDEQRRKVDAQRDDAQKRRDDDRASKQERAEKSGGLLEKFWPR